MTVPTFVRSGFLIGSALLAQPSFADVENEVSANDSGPVKIIVFTAGASLPDGYKPFKTTGGTGNIVYALYDEKGEKETQLPAELSFGQDGVIRGVVPAMAGVNNSPTTYEIKALDEGGGIASKKISLRINPPLNVEIDPIRLTAGGNPSNPIYPFKISGGTGKTEITFVDKSGATVKAPGGLVFGREGGITGKVPSDTAELDGMQARIIDEGGGILVKNIKWNINPPMTAAIINPEITAGGEIPRDLIPVKISGGTPDIKLMIYEKDGVSPAALPDGVEFNELNGSLAGKIKVPDAMDKTAYPAERTYIVKAVDQGGGSLESKFILKINKFLQLSGLL